MGMLSFFRKSTHQEISKSIANKIVLCALKYRDSIEDDVSLQFTADAGAEYAYLLIHLADLLAFKVLGEDGRILIYDEVSKLVLDGYCKAVLRPSTPESKILALSYQMRSDLNDRQLIYSQCKSLTGDPFPSRGTLIFALGYFKHLALKRTDQKNVDDILCGKRNMTKAESNVFPDMDDVVLLSVHFLNSIKFVGIENKLKRLL